MTTKEKKLKLIVRFEPKPIIEKHAKALVTEIIYEALQNQRKEAA